MAVIESLEKDLGGLFEPVEGREDDGGAAFPDLMKELKITRDKLAEEGSDGDRSSIRR